MGNARKTEIICWRFMANSMNDMTINIAKWIRFWGSSCCETTKKWDWYFSSRADYVINSFRQSSIIRHSEGKQSEKCAFRFQRQLKLTQIGPGDKNWSDYTHHLHMSAFKIEFGLTGKQVKEQVEFRMWKDPYKPQTKLSIDTFIVHINVMCGRSS